MKRKYKQGNKKKQPLGFEEYILKFKTNAVGWFMVFDATFNNISVRGGQF